MKLLIVLYTDHKFIMRAYKVFGGVWWCGIIWGARFCCWWRFRKKKRKRERDSWLNETSPIYVNRTLLIRLSLVWHSPFKCLTFEIYVSTFAIVAAVVFYAVTVALCCRLVSKVESIGQYIFLERNQLDLRLEDWHSSLSMSTKWAVDISTDAGLGQV